MFENSSLYNVDLVYTEIFLENLILEYNADFHNNISVVQMFCSTQLLLNKYVLYTLELFYNIKNN